MASQAQEGFHYAAEKHKALSFTQTWGFDYQFTYSFENAFHPFVGELIQQLNRKSIDGLFDANYQQALTTDFFATAYTLYPTNVVAYIYQPKEIDIDDGGPYANYNWELLFHIPLTIAVHLSKNQRFAEAQRWFHRIFDPTSNDTNIPAPQRFWKFLRFRQQTDVQQIDALLALLSKPDSECTADELKLKKKIQQGYEAIMANPFKPHAVARMRTVAYQYAVVMKYLDNLIAWGDSLFIQDTIEAINEATLHYVLAANILGPRPQQVPDRGTVRPRTFAELKQAGLDLTGNALVQLEDQFPFNASMPAVSGSSGPSDPLFGSSPTLYFCVPRNSEKLLTYWDVVADRLFKIRHCMNIEGVVRQLALFDPPIDPGMLVKAAAAGIDVSSIVSGVNQPIAPVRSQVLMQKALELAGEVRSLGSALLSAIEKQDGEHLALLRQGHEIALQQMTQDVRFLQWKQAQESTETLLRSRAVTLERYRFYLRMTGIAVDSNAVPDTLALDRQELTQDNFDATYASLVAEYDKTITPQDYPALRLAGAGAPSTASGASGAGTLYLSTNEDVELNSLLPMARDARLAASVAEVIAGVLTFIPDFNLDLHFWGLGAHANVFGGMKLADAIKIGAEITRTVSTYQQDQAAMASRTASYERRAGDWILQANIAARELVQMGRQIISSLIAEQVAHHEYLTVQAQIQQAKDVDQFLNEKFTTEELYGWMQGEISSLYYQYYRFAFDTARKAERAMKHELMRPEIDATDYVKFNYWDAGRRGLLSGEGLYLDVKRMEMAYHDSNTWEKEITRHVSLRQLDPLALLTLRATGSCEFAIPEWFFDRDHPAYVRRIKTAAISLPSVVGPYTSLNCTLSLLRSSVRKSPLLKDGAYARTGSEDDRFIDYFGSVQSVVTSGGVNDAGLFETNLHDERLLPFEGMGAISAWRLDLPTDFRAFDYLTISDVILHLRYTARSATDEAASQMRSELRSLLSTANAAGLALLFSIRHDFPGEWSAFTGGTADLQIRLSKDQFPYMVQGETLVVDAIDLYAANGSQLPKRSVTVPAGFADDLNGPTRTSSLGVPQDATVLRRDPAAQVFLVVRYRIGS